ncbi:MAG: glycosyltransferase [Bacteroidota bacterium]|nr:glycosyltransferase [Bacteroidota bacterium]
MLINRHLNVVSFDVPYPPNYGGVIDVFFKIKSLHEAGIKVHLHCYQYGREESLELVKICESVNYYKRLTSKRYLFHNDPFIVISRQSDNLINNLLENDYPILFEGLHTCYYLNDERISKRRRIVRTHNIEHDYYSSLARVEKNLFKKFYFNSESTKLYNFENQLSHATAIASISRNDKEYFSSKYNNVNLVSAFHPNNAIDIEQGRGEYVLYHGSLSIGENNEAALFLVNNVFNDIDIPFIIAGNNPSRQLVQVVNNKKNINLVDNVSTEKIYELIHNAQINILPTFQATGIKLKLLAALYKGRHCVVNRPMIINTGLEELCIIRDTKEELKSAVIEYFSKPFTNDEIKKRDVCMYAMGFSNKKNVDTLIEIIFN